MAVLKYLLRAFLGAAVLSDFASATCSTFKQTVDLGVPGPPALLAFKAAAEHSQGKQVTPGIACGRPELTRQNYGPWGSQPYSGPATDISCMERQGTCFVEPKGHVFYSAQTNLTALPDPRAPDASDTPSARIIDLAIDQAPRFQPTHELGIKGVRVGTQPVTGVASYCMHPGHSAWAVVEPRMICIEGVLLDCDKDGSKLEQNGVGVMVCAPQFETDSDPPEVNPHSVHLHSVTAQEAAMASKNPATQPFPELPGAARRSAEAVGLAYAVALATVLATIISM